MPHRKLRELYRDEFQSYDAARFRMDLFAGLTVAAVALPLALAFGVASGATAAAGMVTAIAAGLLIGALSGAPYQISGPTGAMSAVLLVLAHKYGLQGVWIAGALSGLGLLAIGVLRLGRFIAFIPSPVIAGFTSGIALIIAIGQIDNILGVTTPTEHSAAGKLLGYLHGGFVPDWHSIVLGMAVVALMLMWPRRWAARFPASLLGIVLATAAAALLRWPVDTIGAIPQTLWLPERLSIPDIPWTHIQDFIFPALSITALGAVESLLCGAVASNITGIRLAANQELIGQGVGNFVIPFLGGVPATAAIARTSVGIRSGGRTRLTSIVHALALLLSVLVAAPVMSRIPLAALAGVLLVTAWRMNEWESIHFIFGRRFKTAMITFLITMLTTVVLDLTQAILVGAFLSGAVFLNQIASIEVRVEDVDPDKLRARGIEVSGDGRGVRVAWVIGPLFFAATGTFNETFAPAHLEGTRALVLSLRGMPLIDTSGLQALAALHERLQERGGMLFLAAVHPPVQRMLERSGLMDAIGSQNIYSSADQAIVSASERLAGRPDAVLM
jgi:SulP family sulfate permease